MKRVLLVEDDEAVMDATCMMLEESGHQVRCAADWDGALRTVQDGFQPDVIVTDYRLPGRNGIEVVRGVRDVVAWEVPAILITGDTSARAIFASATRRVQVLRKPMDTDRFIRLIEAADQPGGWDA